MKVSPISNTQPQFKAKVSSTKEFSELMSYLHKHVNDKAPWYNSAEDLELVNRVTNAFIAFPSNADLKFSVMYRKNECFNARGVVESQYAKFTDTEPARSDSAVPIPNIMKRILNPDNKDQFNKLMGNKDEKIRDIWWKFYIGPLWDKIKENFYEDTVYKQETCPDFDYLFRRQNP